MVALFLQVFRSIDSGSVKGFPTDADEVRTQVKFKYSGGHPIDFCATLAHSGHCVVMGSAGGHLTSSFFDVIERFLFCTQAVSYIS
jgi:hypothetical protein